MAVTPEQLAAGGFGGPAAEGAAAEPAAMPPAAAVRLRRSQMPGRAPLVGWLDMLFP
jgi:hypothetical protein